MKGVKMRILLILAVLALLFMACGEDNPYEPDPSPNMAIHIVPSRALVDLSDSLDFSALNIHNVPIIVVWEVEDIVGGNDTFGTIDSAGLYIAPNLVPEIDSVRVVATLIDDVSIQDTAWAVIVDPTKVYVDTSGSDTTGTGSRFSPYRTITHALTQAVSTQEVIVRPGVYNTAGNETFPIAINQGITLFGAGFDSTIVEGSGGRQDRAGAVFAVEQPGIQLKDFCIRTENSDGVGIWIESQFQLTAINIVDNKIVSNYYGIYVIGAGNVRPSIEDNIIRQDSVGIITDGGCQPNIYSNMIDSCFIYGVQISGSSAPNLGENDSTFAGNNRIFDCGPSYNDQYLIYNESPQTIYAIGNIWEYADPDPYIYDDDENPSSGPVLTENP
jgi:hypothetical protein